LDEAFPGLRRREQALYILELHETIKDMSTRLANLERAK